MRILIAEDEYYARKALEQSVREWDEDAEVVTADNGLTALEMLREKKTDILLVDIRMPRMDGLTLTSQIQAEGIEVYSIITSGYSDFEYARSALKSGVREYLLKPIDPDLLCEALENACDEIARRESTRLSSVDCDEMLVRRSARELAAWLDGDAAACPEAAAEFALGGGECFAVQIFGERPGVEKFQMLLQNLFSLKTLKAFPYAMDGNLMGALLFTRSEKEAQAEAAEGVRRMRRGLPRGVRAVVSDSFPACRAGEAYRQAKWIYAIRCLEEDAVLTGASLRRRTEYVHLFDTDQAKMFLYQLSQRREEEALNTAMAALCPLLEDQTASMYCVQDTLNQICAQVNYASAQTAQEGELREPRGVMLSIEQIDTRDQLLGRVRQLIQAACELPGMEKLSHSQEIVSYIRDYIDAHFSENISLKTLASTQLYMNVSYLSRLFKSQTGSSFRTYLTNVRMQKAAQMLCCGNESVTHIAVECGYTDVSHFILLFRRRYGVTPNAYREAGTMPAEDISLREAQDG